MPTNGKLALTLGTIAAISFGAIAASPAASTATTVLQKVIGCHGVTDNQQRLACYDAAVSDLLAGAKAGEGPVAAAEEVIVISKAQVRDAKRQAFGFDLSALSIFDRGEKPEVIDKISTVVERAYQTGSGRWILEMENASTWEQTDDEKVWKGPKKGSKADIRKASLGSYFINLDGQRAIRARRVK